MDTKEGERRGRERVKMLYGKKEEDKKQRKLNKEGWKRGKKTRKESSS